MRGKIRNKEKGEGRNTSKWEGGTSHESTLSEGKPDVSGAIGSKKLKNPADSSAGRRASSKGV